MVICYCNLAGARLVWRSNSRKSTGLQSRQRHVCSCCREASAWVTTQPDWHRKCHVMTFCAVSSKSRSFLSVDRWPGAPSRAFEPWETESQNDMPAVCQWRHVVYDSRPGFQLLQMNKICYCRLWEWHACGKLASRWHAYKLLLQDAKISCLQCASKLSECLWAAAGGFESYMPAKCFWRVWNEHVCGVLLQGVRMACLRCAVGGRLQTGRGTPSCGPARSE